MRSEQARGSQTGSGPHAWVCEAVGSGDGMLRALQPSKTIQALVRDMPSIGVEESPCSPQFLSELSAYTPVAKLPWHLM